MPQMAPISWLMLFTVFSVTFITFNVINYFSFISQPPSSIKQQKLYSKEMNWKW